MLLAFSLHLTLTLGLASTLGSKGWVWPCGFSGFGSLQGRDNHLLAPTAGWVESTGLLDGAGMRGKPCWCSKNSKAVHYYCTSTHQHSSFGRFITISLGTCKCSQPLFFCCSLMSDRCCVGRWTSSQSPGGCLRSISLSVSISFSPHSWGYYFASCVFYFCSFMCHACLEVDFYNSCCSQTLVAVFSPHIRGRWSL